jgi:DNA replication protein DnaD
MASDFEYKVKNKLLKLKKNQAWLIDEVKKKHDCFLDSAYMSKIIDNWLSSGIKTAEDVEKSQEQYKNKQKLSMSTFDTDDFFEAALERSNEELKKWRKE